MEKLTLCSLHITGPTATMDANSKRKITRNFRVVKERISVDLNFFVDRLIETSTFTMQIKVS